MRPARRPIPTSRRRSSAWRSSWRRTRSPPRAAGPRSTSGTLIVAVRGPQRLWPLAEHHRLYPADRDRMGPGRDHHMGHDLGRAGLPGGRQHGQGRLEDRDGAADTDQRALAALLLEGAARARPDGGRRAGRPGSRAFEASLNRAGHRGHGPCRAVRRGRDAGHRRLERPRRDARLRAGLRGAHAAGPVARHARGARARPPAGHRRRADARSSGADDGRRRGTRSSQPSAGSSARRSVAS